MNVRALSCHARYRCRHSGACCTSGWPIPIEDDRLAVIRQGIDAGRLGSAAPRTHVVRPEQGGLLLAQHDGRCVFFDSSSRLCRIQEALGHGTLPLACRQFPRVVVRDPRGVSVVLSHYCPTAASLLENDGVVTIDASPEAFPASAEYEGLDAHQSLPPLLRHDVLMDWESWWEFEALAVDMLANSSASPGRALARLHRVVEEIRIWRPGDGALVARVRGAFDRAPADSNFAGDTRARLEEIARALPDVTPWPAPAPQPAGDPLVKRYLAAHAFANWTAHLGHGLRAWRRSIEAAYALVVSGLDIRRADLLLRHLADPRALARAWNAAEYEGSLTRPARFRRAGRSSRS